MCGCDRVRLVCVQWTQCQTQSRHQRGKLARATHPTWESATLLCLCESTQRLHVNLSPLLPNSLVLICLPPIECVSQWAPRRHKLAVCYVEVHISDILFLVPKPARPHLYICTQSNQKPLYYYCPVQVTVLQQSNQPRSKWFQFYQCTNQAKWLSGKNAWLCSLVCVKEDWLTFHSTAKMIRQI